MKKTAKLGITAVAALALPLALAAEWATERDAAKDAVTTTTALATPDSAAVDQWPSESVASEMKIYPSF